MESFRQYAMCANYKLVCIIEECSVPGKEEVQSSLEVGNQRSLTLF